MCQVVQQLLHERITTMIILSHCVGKAGGGGGGAVWFVLPVGDNPQCSLQRVGT